MTSVGEVWGGWGREAHLLGRGPREGGPESFPLPLLTRRPRWGPAGPARPRGGEAGRAGASGLLGGRGDARMLSRAAQPTAGLGRAPAPAAPSAG